MGEKEGSGEGRKKEEVVGEKEGRCGVVGGKG